MEATTERSRKEISNSDLETAGVRNKVSIKGQIIIVYKLAGQNSIHYPHELIGVCIRKGENSLLERPSCLVPTLVLHISFVLAISTWPSRRLRFLPSVVCSFLLIELYHPKATHRNPNPEPASTRYTQQHHRPRILIREHVPQLASTAPHHSHPHSHL